MLPLTYMGIEFQSLLERHPVGRDVPFLHGLGPQHQDVNALIGNAVGAQEPRDAPGCVLHAPRLQPRADPFLEVGNDAIDLRTGRRYAVAAQSDQQTGALDFARQHIDVDVVVVEVVEDGLELGEGIGVAEAARVVGVVQAGRVVADRR